MLPNDRPDLITRYQEEGISKEHFRLNPDVYESTLADWTKFTLSTCRRPIVPNRLELTEDGGLWLLHEVPDGGDPIRCEDGRMVRILKLGLAKDVAERHH